MAGNLPRLDSEWLEADGLGGFAMGTVGLVRTRRYHALLQVATTPPTGRVLLVNGADVYLETASGTYALSTQAYAPDTLHPDGARRVAWFASEPWPTWRLRAEDGTEIEQEIFAVHGEPTVVVRWRRVVGSGVAQLRVVPFVSGRDHHALHAESAERLPRVARDGGIVTLDLGDGLPEVRMLANGRFQARPDWYRRFLYRGESERGLDAVEDLATPGEFVFDLTGADAHWILSAAPLPLEDPVHLSAGLRAREAARRARFAEPLARAADQYLVRRADGLSVVAGYPWFTDWGRDTFLALRGLCLATGRLDEAWAVLRAWAPHVSQGMLPNRFPDRGEAPEYGSVDAALWFVVAVHETLRAAARAGREVGEEAVEDLVAAVLGVLEAHLRGTRHGIRVTEDGLLAAGVPGLQLTWMDARVGGREITPRIGKPVEVQALWLNALRAGALLDPRYGEPFTRALASFHVRFWNPDRACLYDVVDADHHTGAMDAALRPNQILAVGGLPASMVTRARARAIVQTVEAHLLTPLGLRSLAPGEAGYRPRFEGGPEQRDGAYHQGTVWPWLIGPFAEAWVRAGFGTPAQARDRFLPPLLRHLEEAGLGHVSEVFDAEAPQRPGGCPFQAWSLAELLRIRDPKWTP